MRAYLLTLIKSTLAALAIAAAFLIAVDGSALLHTRIAPERLLPKNYRVDVGAADRAVKAAEIARQKPKDVLFFGSSRVQFAFDPKLFPEFTSYNAAVRGGRLHEGAAVLNYALDFGPSFGRAVIVNDFWEFYNDGSAFAPETVSAFTHPDPWRTYGRMFFSYDMVRRSVQSLSAALVGKLRFVFDTDGFYNVENAVVYTTPDFATMPNLRNWFDPFLARARGKFRTLLAKGLDEFVAAAQEAKKRGVDIDVVLLSEHIARLALYRRIGLWDDYEEWKRQWADAAARIEAAPGEGQIRIFDFNLADKLSATPFVPDEKNRYFFETLHVRPIVARMVVARLQNFPDADPSFGRPLEASLSDSAFAGQRAAVDQWIADHPGERAQIDALIAKNR